MGTEIELKLVTSKAGLRKVLTLPWLKRMAGDGIRTQGLVSVYFDTRDLALRDHGVSLRVRRIGEHRLQTIKALSTVPMARGEWEAQIEGDRPKLKLARRTALAPILTDDIARRLKPVFETRVERTLMPLQVGRSEIELAVDEGRVAAADSSVDIAEIEIELKRGAPADIARLARRLAHEIPVALGVRAKAGWGAALLEGTVDAPMRADAIVLAPSATVADAFVVIGFSCLRQIAANERAVRRHDPEGVHQMRVGLRRLRAALSLFRDMLRGDETDRLKGELKWLTGELGPARDTDVLISKTVAPCLERQPESGEFEMLARDLEAERTAGFARAGRALENGRFGRLVLDCALWLIDGAWRNDDDDLRRAQRERPADSFAQEELARRRRKIIKRVRKVERLDAMRRHKLRIAVKKLRYAREFFASLDRGRPGRKRRRRADRALKGLQSALGTLNDMRAHRYVARDFARANAASRKAFAIGYLTGREEAREAGLLGEACSAGKLLKKAA
ncbi:MAG: CHAD domain-containing protein [Bradyrhizobium sp.]|uniref:CYTH and CHAD domain-containing protein n=1 Tax=Bradyrhizobium sp. TaxID=376 RepID=UPI001D679580|nr:CYTH and CHAD domain-containing protein [Bradyrhizobium sp.]MBV9561034.1 CHAD domain-containing protein [Bradyrhizobium sp.]